MKADGTSLIYIDRHLVHEALDEQLPLLLRGTWPFTCSFVEVTSPQAFEGLRLSSREAAVALRFVWELLLLAPAFLVTLNVNVREHEQVRRTDCTLATVDHNIPTSSRKNFKDFAQQRAAREGSSLL